MHCKTIHLKPKVSTVASQPSWITQNDQVSVAITQLGGQMAPVTFYRDSNKTIQPYYISPWQDENRKITEPVLAPLRGDFFCMPFGGNAEEYRGEKHCCHGEPAGAKWRFVDLARIGTQTRLTLSMRTRVRPGKITKHISLLDGHNVVYCQHILEGYSGAMPLGHHPCLRVPEEGSMRLSTSDFDFGMTSPGIVGDPAAREYQSLAVGKIFKSLKQVPTLWKDSPTADCTTFPARTGFTDIIAIFTKTGSKAPRMAWTTATVQRDGYLWFVLKNPAMLPATVLWISNRGRHGRPWNGRNRCLGIEDVCGYFADGLAASVRPNFLRKKGVATSVKLSPHRPAVVNHIQGVVKIPSGFDMVHRVELLPGALRFISVTNKKVQAPVKHEFIFSGSLCD